MRVVSFYRNVYVMLQNAVTVLKNSKLLFMRFCDFTILSGFYYERFCCIELLIARPARLALFTRRLFVNLILRILGRSCLYCSQVTLWCFLPLDSGVFPLAGCNIFRMYVHFLLRPPHRRPAVFSFGLSPLIYACQKR